MRVLFVKKKFLDLILAGKKPVEVRVCYPSFEKLKPGDTILLNRQFPFKIKRISKYKNFSELLENEDPEKIYPGKTKKEILEELRSLYPSEKEKLGVIAIEIEVLDKKERIDFPG